MAVGKIWMPVVLAVMGLYVPTTQGDVVVFAATGAGGGTTGDPPYKEVFGGWAYKGFRSTQSPPGSGSRSTTSSNASFRITPTLANPGGLYRVTITHPVRSGSDQVSGNILVNVAVAGGTMADAAGTPVTSTAAFRRPGGNTWETVGRLRLNPGATSAVITFTAVGSYTDRFYADGFKFESVEPCPVPFADTDEDGDVDQEDFASLQRCFSGSGLPPRADCDCLDRDPAGADLDIDGQDLEEFQKCATGPLIAWDQTLTPDCVP